jgi:anti-sigma factor RsiW
VTHPYDAGPYVLGALDPDERRLFEDHLSTCAECRAEVQDFAGLPGLLSRLPTAEAVEVLKPETAPVTPLSPTLLATVRKERRARRWRAVAIGSAAAAAVALVVGLGTTLGRGDDGTLPPAALPTSTVALEHFTAFGPKVPAVADARISSYSGITRIDMTCHYTGPDDDQKRTWVLRYVPKNGAPQVLASWPILSDEDYSVGVVAPLPREEIKSFEVTNAKGDVLLTLPA